MRVELLADDYQEARDIMMGVIDFEPTDAQVDAALAHDDGIMPLVIRWTWHDTEVREQLAAALEAVVPPAERMPVEDEP